ncbi:MAG TPA: hypothetical protein PLP57_04565 [Candidatus Saccharicenans sp.]|jgi:hypothetical protein|nr:hypothetical protein [Candidatus Saccharicenans sp.]HRD01900.1 hypothetical protein [Candidatus Saccharicenans sp.]
MSKVKNLTSILCLVLVLVFSFQSIACKGKEAEEDQPKAVEENINRETLKPILGEAIENSSGLVDVTGDIEEIIISYRYYDADGENYDEGLVQDLASKIEKLYKTFKKLDRVVFQVSVNDPATSEQWKPYVTFTINREVVEKIEWSNILAEDFFKNVIDTRWFD